MFNTSANTVTLTVGDTAQYLESIKHQPSYPPYNLVKYGEVYKMEMALAGYSEESLKVYEKEHNLFIEHPGQVSFDKQTPQYIHKGISGRQFKRSWKMPEDWIIKDATMKNGMLTITFDEVVPEEKKPKYFIGGE
tara:strand:+ start:180 stop:584 length:405 start_codon:yes stop_codon:yes gene_type:complete